MLPTVTFIIPVPPGAPPPPALAAIERLSYPRDRIEIIVAEGTNPSAQRNQAIAAAHGDILYFLDDDSELDSLALILDSERDERYFGTCHSNSLHASAQSNGAPDQLRTLEPVFARILSQIIHRRNLAKDLISNE